MIDELTTVARQVFDYPDEPLSRQHGPLGYTDYRSFKPWLRDEFSFRCVLCLDRERWHPNGHEEFSVDHVEPQSIAAEQATDYDNLLYTCCTCNRNRRAAALPLDPYRDVLCEHLAVRPDGTIQGRTPKGTAWVHVGNLNRPLAIEFRARMMSVIELLIGLESADGDRLLETVLGFPKDLPDLRVLRPPGGNARPVGVENCCYERRLRNELPAVY